MGSEREVLSTYECTVYAGVEHVHICCGVMQTLCADMITFSQGSTWTLVRRPNNSEHLYGIPCFE